MKRFLLAASASILLATAASAQSGQAGSDNPALKDNAPHSMPAHGESSLTEAQARDRLMKSGYTGIATLTKRDGAWHGTAMKDGKSVSVTLDDKGTVTTH
ncbi:MAG TPA: hypothetical protein VNS79_10920 [Sphingobium sp.]|nr:hypothetical protein [Sphingobium sp.]